MDRRRPVKLASLVAAVALSIAFAAGGGTALAKKKHSKSPTANVTVNANQVVPPETTATSQGILTSTAGQTTINVNAGGSGSVEARPCKVSRRGLSPQRTRSRDPPPIAPARVRQEAFAWSSA